MLKPLLTDPHAHWKQRFRVATMESSQIASNNPTRGLICSNTGGIFQLHAWDVTTGNLRQLTHEPHGNLLGAISPDGDFVYVGLDPDGDQYGHLARMPFEGGTIQDLTPGFPQYPLGRICLSATGNMLAFAVPRPGDEGTDLYVISIEGQPGEPRHLFYDPIPGLHGRKRLALSADGDILIFASNERNPALVERLLAIDIRTATQFAELWDGVQNSVSLGDCSPVSGDARVLAILHRGDTRQELLWNPRTGEQFPLDWQLPGQITPVTWTPNGSHILLYQEHNASQRHVLYSLNDGSMQAMDEVPGLYWSVSFGKEHTMYIHSEGRRPAEILAMDMLTGKVKGVIFSGGPVPAGQPWTSVTFSSSDGTPVQSWLITPEGEGPFPAILFIHGGPHACVWEGYEYEPDLQLWTDHGFAVFAVNYRGSTGFGRAFEEQVIGRPGYWELEDIVAGRNWLIEQGIARPDALLITGWSYGGYLSLLALGMFPDLWTGGMAGYAIADWIAYYEEAGEGVKSSVLFGGTPQEKSEQYRISSPITYANQIQAPLFIYQGRNDPGGPPRQMERYVNVLQQLGKPVEIIWIDSGHGTLDTAQKIATQEQLLRFANSVLHEKQD